MIVELVNLIEVALEKGEFCQRGVVRMQIEVVER